MKMPTENTTAPTLDNSRPVSKNLIIMLVALLALVGGLLAYWFLVLNTQVTTPTPSLRPPLENNAEPETPTATAQTESFGAMSTSDEITAIEADIESTNLDSLEAEMLQIDAELEAATQE